MIYYLIEERDSISCRVIALEKGRGSGSVCVFPRGGSRGLMLRISVLANDQPIPIFHLADSTSAQQSLFRKCYSSFHSGLSYCRLVYFFQFRIRNLSHLQPRYNVHFSFVIDDKIFLVFLLLYTVIVSFEPNWFILTGRCLSIISEKSKPFFILSFS